MANVKKVDISGELPFNCYEYEDFNFWLGYMNSPSAGIHIQWSDAPIKHERNSHGGQTAIYGFAIHGQDALRYESLDAIVQSIEVAGGKVDVYTTMDLEA